MWHAECTPVAKCSYKNFSSSALALRVPTVIDHAWIFARCMPFSNDATFYMGLKLCVETQAECKVGQRCSYMSPVH